MYCEPLWSRMSKLGFYNIRFLYDEGDDSVEIHYKYRDRSYMVTVPIPFVDTLFRKKGVSL